jgi:hypothetical protein
MSKRPANTLTEDVAKWELNQVQRETPLSHCCQLNLTKLCPLLLPATREKISSENSHSLLSIAYVPGPAVSITYVDYFISVNNIT